MSPYPPSSTHGGTSWPTKRCRHPPQRPVKTVDQKTSMSCICNPTIVTARDSTEYPFDPLWGNLLGDCIYTPQQQWSVIFGLASVAGFAIAFVPQFHHNYKRKSMDGFSMRFMAVSTVGAMANTLGAFLTQQFATQLYFGLLVLSVQLLVIVQYIYYTIVYPRISVRQSTSTGTVVSFAASVVPLVAAAAFAAASANKHPEIRHFSVTSLKAAPICNARPAVSPTAEVVGVVLAWTCGVLFSASRIPQILAIVQRRSAAGIAPSFILLLFTTNACYVASILLRIDEVSSAKLLQSTLPFLLGSLGPMAGDLIITGLWIKYSRGSNNAVDDAKSLDDNSDGGSEDDETTGKAKSTVPATEA
ncbi:PQ loop repeat-domain-containing protein [Blastocladiella britannica]|nr:PQ loop repeat-domain-containing protein [Blastocladiella britannica]